MSSNFSCFGYFGQHNDCQKFETGGSSSEGGRTCPKGRFFESFGWLYHLSWTAVIKEINVEKKKWRQK
jgi:hypothetical protein